MLKVSALGRMRSIDTECDDQRVSQALHKIPNSGPTLKKLRIKNNIQSVLGHLEICVHPQGYAHFGMVRE